MLPTYKAIVKGNTIEWCNDVSEHIKPDSAVAVHITVLDESVPMTREERGQYMASALESLAEINALPAVRDPLAWERELRQERPLPGRET